MTPGKTRSSARQAGSPQPGEPVFLVVGKLCHPHGVKGELFMELSTDFPERLHNGVTVFVGPAYRSLRLKSCRGHRDGLLVIFAEYTNPEEAGSLRNQLVYVRTDDRPQLPPGDFYHHQIIGLSALNKTGEILGQVVDILETGASDVLIIRSQGGKEFLLPFTDENVEKVDLQENLIIVHPLIEY